MRKHKITLCILGLTLCFTTPSFAFDLNNFASFGLGFTSGAVFHEVGHASAAWLQGAEVTEFGLFSIDVKHDSSLSIDEKNKQAQLIGLGGYISQSLATEIILQNKNWHQNNYALGWMAIGIYVNLSNPIRHYIFNLPTDLYYYQKAGGDPLIPTLFMLTHASFSLYRILLNPTMSGFLENQILMIPLISIKEIFH